MFEPLTQFMPAMTMSFGGIMCAMIALWLVSLPLRNAAIVDVFWGPGFVLVGLVTAFAAAPLTPRGLLILGLVALWALRLSLHIFVRNRKKPEDFRYAAWRSEHGGRWAWISLFQVFLLQGIILWIVSMTVQFGIISRTALTISVAEVSGILLWITGFMFQTVGDAQLARFKRDPSNHGAVLDRGLWRFTRHPNYFGEALIWWGIWLMTVSVELGPFLVFSPLLMHWLLVRISGVALLERALKKRPDYAAYIARTNAFFPWFPRKTPA